jgi:hypothetical protein
VSEPATPADKIRAGLLACGRAGMQTPAMFALNAHVFGTRQRGGIGLEAAVLDPPADPQQFSASLACNILRVWL